MPIGGIPLECTRWKCQSSAFNPRANPSHQVPGTHFSILSWGMGWICCKLVYASGWFLCAQSEIGKKRFLVLEDSVFQVWLLGNNHVWVIIKGQSLKQWCYNGLCRSWWYRRSQAWTLAPCLFGNKGLTEESSALRVRAYKNRCRRMFLQAQKRHFLTPMSYTMVCCCPAWEGKLNLTSQNCLDNETHVHVRSSRLIQLTPWWIDSIWWGVEPLPSPPVPAWKPLVARYDARATCWGA